ncbi:MAG: sulfate permease [Flavobacteriaceae bacterium]|nr:sulfate permease [Flavobacteriaceae bacterium]MDG1687309.1 sulfate permease [Flavobacteriaceae bacterium]MDG2235766.1 sulfate permease [Flavobacteriaceae bacterium]
MKTFIPILNWLPDYKSEYLKDDFIAGVTVAVLLIPQGMAYALIAGLPPIYGLYAALTPQIIYAFLGTSRQLAVGPVAMDSLLVAAGLGALSIVDSNQYIQMAILLALTIGAIQFLLGLLKMGFIVNFLSKPVISGFTSAAAIIICLNQLRHILGISISQSNKIHVFTSALMQSETPINLHSLIIGIVSIILLILIKGWSSKIPSALVIVVIGICWVTFTHQIQPSVAIVGNIPDGLPNFSFPPLKWEIIKELIPISLTIALVAFMEAISIAKSIQEKHKTYEINPNQELLALGASNMIGSFFQSYPTTGGFSRTAVNNEAGAKTGVAALISALIVAIILTFFTDWFYYLPKSVLGAIIIVAVIKLIDYKYAIRLYKIRKDEFLVLLITFIATLFIGITEGILFGIIFSFLLLVYRTSKPHYAFLGRIGSTNYFKNIKRFPDEVVLRDDLIILRFDAQLFFGNIHFFKKLVFDSLNKNPRKVKGFIINARSMNYIDSTAIEQLIDIIEKIQEKGIRVMLVGATGPTRDSVIKSKLINVVKKGNLFITSGDATDSFDKVCKKSSIQKKLSRQTN